MFFLISVSDCSLPVCRNTSDSYMLIFYIATLLNLVISANRFLWILFFFTSIKIFIYLFIFNFIILYWFCHTSTCICHGCTRVPHPEPPSCLPPHTIPLGHPSAPGVCVCVCVIISSWNRNRFTSILVPFIPSLTENHSG